MNNQKGLTLIEILAAVTILTIVGAIIWSVFLQGTNYSRTAMEKNQLIQEANIVITNLKNIHQESEWYQITSPNGCDLKIEKKKKSTGVEIVTFENPKICYKIENFTNEDGDDLIIKKLIPTAENSIQFDLLLNDIKHPEQSISIHANLFRLKE